jgi:hypothetical protein
MRRAQAGGVGTEDTVLRRENTRGGRGCIPAVPFSYLSAARAALTHPHPHNKFLRTSCFLPTTKAVESGR